METNYLYEEWRPVKGYEGLYEISNYGRVRSLNYYGKGICKIMHLTAGWGKYIKAGLRDRDGNIHYHYVHRLVAIAFLPTPPPEKTQVNHISGDRQDSMCVEGFHVNIEWVSPKDNANNPSTKPNYYKRYHREGEFARRSAGQRRRFQQHPEDLEKMRTGYRKYQEKRKTEKLQFGFV